MWILSPQTIVILAALLPCAVLLYYIYSHDTIEKEPTGLLVRLFLFGCLSTIPAMIIEMAAAYVMEYLGMQETTVVYMLIENFLVVALAEEGCKRFFLKRGSWDNPAFNYLFDGVVYSVFVSLGFAGAENIGYIAGFGLEIAPMRALLAIPLHCICAVFMGHFYGLAKYYERCGMPDQVRSNRFLSLLIPVLIHGFYDFCASSESDVMSIVFLVFVVVMDIIAIRSVKKYSASDTPL